MKWLTEPSGVAIIGASQDFSTINGKILRYLIKHNYEGRIYPVNPKYSQIGDFTCYPTLSAIPEEVELALVAVAAGRVPGILRDCGAKGIKGVVIFSSGFAETGEKAIQSEIQQIASQFNMRLIGPNCLGVLNVPKRLTATFSASLDSEEIKAGPVSLVSQSGAVGFMIFNLLQEVGVGVDLVVTTGNEADLTAGEALAHVIENPSTRVLLSYLEGLRDGDSFKRAAKRALELGKPLIVLKGGNSASGQSAAATHTAALTGSAAAYRSSLSKLGVLEAEDTEDLVDLAQAFIPGKLPKGPRVGIITMSGGVGILLADRCEENGLVVPRLSEGLQEELRKVIPAFGCAQNPIDVTAQSLNQGNEFQRCINLLLESEEVDIVVVAIAMATGKLAEKLGRDIVECAQKADKPLVVGWTVGQVAKPGFEVLQEAGIPLYHSPTRTIDAASALYKYAESRQSIQETPVIRLDTERLEKVQQILASRSDTLGERESKEIMALYNLPVTKERLATSPEEAMSAAAELGYPVVMKIDSPDIIHKTEAQGVAINIQDSQEVLKTYNLLIHNAHKYNNAARLNGVLVQEQVSPGLEVIIGLQRDPVFGPMILFGLGGIFVEVLKDVVLKPLPLSRDEAWQMLEQIKGSALLSGVRGRPAVDKEALVEVLLGVAQLGIEADPYLESLDLNPVVVLPVGQGVRILDGVLVTNQVTCK